MTDDLHTLWHRVLQDDRDAWATIIMRFARLVHTVGVRAGLSDADAEDCGQQVWLSLYRSRRRLRDPDRLPSWLIQTARRRAMRMVRQMATRDRYERGQEDREAPPIPDEDIVLLERRFYLTEALANMDSRCQKLLTQLFFAPEKVSYNEIARGLGLSPNALGPLRQRCLKRLKKILEEIGYPADES